MGVKFRGVDVKISNYRDLCDIFDWRQPCINHLKVVYVLRNNLLRLQIFFLKSLKFEISELKSDGETQNYVLKKKITGSIYRVVSGDPVLTNSFWNFYV